MKAKNRILCFGDSITRGRIPLSLERYDERYRRTTLLQQSLGCDYVVVEEGLRGRTLMNSTKEGRSGLSYFFSCILSHFPLDTIILFLGTNDILQNGEKFLLQIQKTLFEYDSKIKIGCNEFQTPVPKVLLVTPPYINNTKLCNPISGLGEIHREVDELYSNVSGILGWNILNSGEIVGFGDGDGIHLSKEQNLALSNEFLRYVRSS